MRDFLHTSSWMVGRRSPHSLGRYEGIVLYDLPQRIPRAGPDGLVREVMTPTPWRRAFLWWPVRAIELQGGGTVARSWFWLKRVERRTHYGVGRGETLVEVRVPPPLRHEPAHG